MRADPFVLEDAASIGAIALDVLVASHLEPPDIALRQAGRLRALIEATAKRSPFYRRRWQGNDLNTVRLEQLPPVGKRELMRHFDDWVADPQVSLQAISAFVADPRRSGDPFLDKYLVWESSGSSGEPAIFVQDARALAVYDALEASRRGAQRGWQRLFDPLMLCERYAFVGAIDGHFATHASMQRLRRLNPWLTAGWRGFSILQPAASLVKQLNEFAPTILATYPTAASMLSDEAARGALRVPLREIWTGGETLTAAVRQRVQQRFGCPLLNSYGASEFLPIAWQCHEGALHVNSDWVILEPVDAHYRAVPPGHRSHTTLLTNLANAVQPLVRYDLGDQIRIAPQRCGCGSPLPVIDVLGRRDDLLQMAGAQGEPVTLLPLALTTVLEDQAGIFDFQLRQVDEHTLRLRLAARAPAAATAGCRVLSAFAKAQGVAPLRVAAETGQALTPGRTGKVQRVVACRPGPRSRTPAVGGPSR